MSYGRAALLVTGMALQLGLASDVLAAEAAWVARINGKPSLTRAGKTEPLQRGATVSIGDRIETDGTSKVKLLLADDSVLAIGPRTAVTIDELVLGPANRTGRLRVLFGRFKLAITAWLSGPSEYQVDTPTAVAGVRGTILWGDTELDAICALRGTVEVRAVRGDAAATLETGQCVTHMGRGETVPLVPTRDELEKYLKDVSLD